MQFSVRFEFNLQRRVPWDDDHETLRAHVDEVTATIAEHASVDRLVSESDPDLARAAIEVSLFAHNQPTAESDSRTIVGKAIRRAGAYHQGLLPPPDELRLRPNLPAWSGLRTPTWQIRTTTTRRERNPARSSVTDSTPPR
jgi:hypothetical protein